MSRLVQGVGINDADYKVRNPVCPIYYVEVHAY